MDKKEEWYKKESTSISLNTAYMSQKHCFKLFMLIIPDVFIPAFITPDVIPELILLYLIISDIITPHVIPYIFFS